MDDIEPLMQRVSGGVVLVPWKDWKPKTDSEIQMKKKFDEIEQLWNVIEICFDLSKEELPLLPRRFEKYLPKDSGHRTPTKKAKRRTASEHKRTA